MTVQKKIAEETVRQIDQLDPNLKKAVQKKELEVIKNRAFILYTENKKRGSQTCVEKCVEYALTNWQRDYALKKVYSRYKRFLENIDVYPLTKQEFISNNDFSVFLNFLHLEINKITIGTKVVLTELGKKFKTKEINKECMLLFYNKTTYRNPQNYHNRNN